MVFKCFQYLHLHVGRSPKPQWRTSAQAGRCATAEWCLWAPWCIDLVVSRCSKTSLLTENDGFGDPRQKCGKALLPRSHDLSRPEPAGQPIWSWPRRSPLMFWIFWHVGANKNGVKQYVKELVNLIFFCHGFFRSIFLDKCWVAEGDQGLHTTQAGWSKEATCADSWWRRRQLSVTTGRGEGRSRYYCTYYYHLLPFW